MKKIECPSCAVEVDEDNDVCPICGYDFPKQPLTVKVGVWILILLMFLWLLF